jgi:chemotaxis protein methyltransferase CheR
VIVKDADCISFLQWALPRIRLDWGGFRKVRRIVCKRIDRRYRALGLGDLAAYRRCLDTTPAEWHELRRLCSIPISRFSRDRAVFHSLEHAVLPALAAAAADRGERRLECWSAGCASGEEPYTLSMLWQFTLAARYPDLALHVLATDVDPVLLERAAAACYRASALKELPHAWRAAAFDKRGEEFCVRQPFRTAVRFVHQDLCVSMPDQLFDLILCRNVVFTYFSSELQRQIVRQLADRLRVGGALVVGIHELLPQGAADFVAWPGVRAVFQRGRGEPVHGNAARADSILPLSALDTVEGGDSSEPNSTSVYP